MTKIKTPKMSHDADATHAASLEPLCEYEEPGDEFPSRHIRSCFKPQAFVLMLVDDDGRHDGSVRLCKAHAENVRENKPYVKSVAKL